VRVAYLNRQRAAHPGGDLTQIDATIAALAPLGIEAVYAPEGWTLDWLRGFDLAHIFHVNFGWSRYNFDRVREAGVPYVVTPIFYPDSSLGMDYDDIREALDGARCVMPNSNVERREMRWAGVLGYDTPAEAIPNGTDRRFHWTDGGDPRTGVLAVSARGMGDKQCALVAELCDVLGLRFTLASGIDDRDELAEIYKRARVFVNASVSERMSLTIGEALCAGCRVIATRANRGNEWYGNGLATFDPTNRVQLAAALKVAYEKREWDWSPNRAARTLTWAKVASRLAEVYWRAVGV
jgi:hypothetical protein